MHSFTPYPLLGNPHVQTVLGTLFGSSVPIRSVPAAVALADGDHVVVHGSASPAWHGGPVALLVHGLGGCHESGYMVRITQRLVALGVRVYRMDLRGCGAGAVLARRLYSAACSDDVRSVLEHLRARHPGSSLLLAGFSLGGGIVLKMAGEAGNRPPPGLCAVAAVAAPLDLRRCSALLARLPLYDAFFVRHLVRQVRRQQRLLPHLPRVRFPRRLTVRQFDDLYTAARWGFAGVDDYYERASALPWLPKIRVPTFLLTARDDPFIAVAPYELLAPAPTLEVHISPRGGHLGFVGPDGAGGIRWAERQVVHWLLHQAARVAGTPTTVDNAITAFRST
jgi:predicted alpha/beta-fold hydrolase